MYVCCYFGYIYVVICFTLIYLLVILEGNSYFFPFWKKTKSTFKLYPSQSIAFQILIFSHILQSHKKLYNISVVKIMWTRAIPTPYRVLCNLHAVFLLGLLSAAYCDLVTGLRCFRKYSSLASENKTSPFSVSCSNTSPVSCCCIR